MRFRNLERYRTGGTGDRMDVAVPLPRTPDGKIVRICPDEACLPGVFQLGNAPEARPEDRAHRRMRLPGARGTTCPYCGTVASDDRFTSPDDVQAALRQIQWAVGRDVGDFLRAVAGEDRATLFCRSGWT